jgi:hypothetical protein
VAGFRRFPVLCLANQRYSQAAANQRDTFFHSQ